MMMSGVFVTLYRWPLQLALAELPRREKEKLNMLASIVLFTLGVPIWLIVGMLLLA